MTAARRQANPQPAPGDELQTGPSPEAPDNHLIIAGTGRAGTSFLVRYLTELGLDTTLSRHGDRAGWDVEANAGLENLLVSGDNLPYVVKSPWISEYIDQILGEKRFKIDAFVVPVRDLVEAATSRVVLEQRSIHQHNPWMADRLDRTWETYGHTAGGLVYSLNPLDQARLLAVQFHRLVLKASEAGVPIVFPVFPRIATDWEYLHKCLRPILPREITEDAARAAHAKSRQCGQDSGHARDFQGAPGNVTYRRSRGPGPITRARSRSTTSRFGAKSAGFDRTQAGIIGRKRRIGWRPRFRSCEPRERERAGLDAAFQRIRQKLERKSIRYKMRRILRLVNRAPAFGV